MRDRMARSVAAVLLLFVAQCARGGDGRLVRAAATPGTPGTSSRLANDETAFGPPAPSAPPPVVPWAKELSPLQVTTANTGALTVVRLYDEDGSINAAEADAFSLAAADSNGAYPLSPRLLQLVVKTAHHFYAQGLVVVSAYRKPKAKAVPDHHAKGEALDFRLPGVDYRKLAAYLRTLPRVGVGVYTDRRTHYVHLDVRDRSFHWLDASPPGVAWREAALADAKQASRDSAYSSDDDLPLDARREPRPLAR